MTERSSKFPSKRGKQQQKYTCANWMKAFSQATAFSVSFPTLFSTLLTGYVTINAEACPETPPWDYCFCLVQLFCYQSHLMDLTYLCIIAPRESAKCSGWIKWGFECAHAFICRSKMLKRKTMNVHFSYERTGKT